MIPRAVVPAAALLAVAFGSACDPAFGLRVRQLLPVRPSGNCLDSALVGSPLVASATRFAERGQARKYEVRLSDPTLGYPPRRLVEIAPAPTPDTTGVIVSVTYHWVGSSRLRAGEERLITAGAEQLLNGLRQVCAPDSPSTIECAYVGELLLRSRACRAAYPTGR